MFEAAHPHCCDRMLPCHCFCARSLPSLMATYVRKTLTFGHREGSSGGRFYYVIICAFVHSTYMSTWKVFSHCIHPDTLSFPRTSKRRHSRISWFKNHSTTSSIRDDRGQWSSYRYVTLFEPITTFIHQTLFSLVPGFLNRCKQQHDCQHARLYSKRTLYFVLYELVRNICTKLSFQVPVVH